MGMHLSVREGDACVIVQVAGEVDLSNADELREGLLDVLDQRSRDLVVDMAELDFVDSTGLSALLVAHRRAGDVGGSLRLAAPKPHVAKVLQVTGLDDVLTVMSSVDDACVDAPETPTGA